MKKYSEEIERKVKELSQEGIDTWAIQQRLGVGSVYISLIKKKYGLSKTRNRRNDGTGRARSQKETNVNRCGTTSANRDDRLHKDS